MLISQASSKFLKKKNSINLGGHLINFSQPTVMGIINVTPDSFYDGGQITSEQHLLAKAEQMITDGVSIIDIGAISTRPGATLPSVKEELARLLPAVVAIRKKFPGVMLSVDTFRAWVAARVTDEVGPVMVNDISGGSLDSTMFETVGKLRAPYILSHIQGTPGNMQDNPQYDDVVRAVSAFFSEKIKQLNKHGVNDIIIDPGFGFGKTVEHNFELLNRLDSLKVFQLPVMVGLSRKSMLCKALDIEPCDALNATTAANTAALLGGADILRVHDVKEAAQTIKIYCKLKATTLN